MILIAIGISTRCRKDDRLFRSAVDLVLQTDFIDATRVGHVHSDLWVKIVDRPHGHIVVARNGGWLQVESGRWRCHLARSSQYFHIVHEPSVKLAPIGLW